MFSEKREMENTGLGHEVVWDLRNLCEGSVPTGGTGMQEAWGGELETRFHCHFGLGLALQGCFPTVDRSCEAAPGLPSPPSWLSQTWSPGAVTFAHVIPSPIHLACE